MIECKGRSYILNGKLHPAESFDNSLVYDGDSIYEVIRMQNNIPVFFTDHVNRLATSAALRGKRMLADESGIRKGILALARHERKKESNLKIVFNYNKGSANYLIYYIETVYPSEEQYNNGVKGILFHAEREQPCSKIINYKPRATIYQELIHARAYEALLVDREGMITEGSRSNIFFLRDDVLVTAPDDTVLNGITRGYIINICSENNIRVVYERVNASLLSNYETVFMTGTSPMVLPFYCIDDITFNVAASVIAKLRSLYIEKTRESIALFRTIITPR
jgi:branched-chain amino acid aminotransferase